jgi:hypothetical protein
MYYELKIKFNTLHTFTSHHLVVAQVRERLSVSKQGVQLFDLERFNFR